MVEESGATGRRCPLLPGVLPVFRINLITSVSASARTGRTSCFVQGDQYPMMCGITGTPGTGKSMIGNRVPARRGHTVIHLTDTVRTVYSRRG